MTERELYAAKLRDLLESFDMTNYKPSSDAHRAAVRAAIADMERPQVTLMSLDSTPSAPATNEISTADCTPGETAICEHLATLAYWLEQIAGRVGGPMTTDLEHADVLRGQRAEIERQIEARREMAEVAKSPAFEPRDSQSHTTIADRLERLLPSYARAIALLDPPAKTCAPCEDSECAVHASTTVTDEAERERCERLVTEISFANSRSEEPDTVDAQDTVELLMRERAAAVASMRAEHERCDRALAQCRELLRLETEAVGSAKAALAELRAENERLQVLARNAVTEVDPSNRVGRLAELATYLGFQVKP